MSNHKLMDKYNPKEFEDITQTSYEILLEYIDNNYLYKGNGYSLIDTLRERKQRNMNNILTKKLVLLLFSCFSVIFYKQNPCFFMICQLTVWLIFDKLFLQTSMTPCKCKGGNAYELGCCGLVCADGILPADVCGLSKKPSFSKSAISFLTVALL